MLPTSRYHGTRVPSKEKAITYLLAERADEIPFVVTGPLFVGGFFRTDPPAESGLWKSLECTHMKDENSSSAAESGHIDGAVPSTDQSRYTSFLEALL
jgi:hypothetical protein